MTASRRREVNRQRPAGVMDAIVVTHNSAQDLQRQLECEPLREAFDRVITVDNASRDESCEVARAAGADVVARERNDGLAAAVNEGARHADGDLFAVMNPDVLLDEPTLPDQLAERFEEPSLGLVAPALRLPDGGLQDSAREVPTPLQLVRRRLGGDPLGRLDPSDIADVDWVVAAFAVIRRSAFEDVGGFDEGYSLYFEDVDFCVRLWRRGWRVRLDPTLVARHEHQAASRRSLTGPAMRKHVRSMLRFFRYNADLLLPTGRRRLVG